MIGAVPNPKKTLEIDFSIDQIKKTIIFIPLKNTKYKLFQKNEILNQYTFEALEFLSLGVYIDINLSAISDTKSKVDIEVRRKVGAFDKSHEVTAANEHIQKLINAISECLILTDEQIIELEKKNETIAQNKNKGCSVVILALIGSLLAFGSVLYSCH
jgi:hypothetical protein